ncbi:MAG: cytochrome c oxidase subunit II [Pseudomonadota bacterium]
MKTMAKIAATLAAGIGTLAASVAMAEDVAGKPVPGGVNFQRPVTPIMHDLVWLDNFLLIIITAISLFVLGLLVYVVVRFNKKRNPVPATFTHNAKLEFVWTAVPVLILVVIAIPSLRLLFDQLDVPEPEVTIKATGHQWFWSYEYPDEGIEFDSYMLTREELGDFGYQSDEYLLATDTRVVVPVDANVHLLTTGGDVIHNWAMPSFGIKADSIPGRINEAWFRAEETGLYFGQCSELCGINHSYMPIAVEVVTREEYDAWVAEQVAKRDGATDFAAAE